MAEVLPKISQQIASQKSSGFISFCQTAVPQPLGMDERRGPGWERGFQYREAPTWENRNERERQRETDIGSGKLRLSPLMTVVRSERRKRVGGIKQLT